MKKLLKHLSPLAPDDSGACGVLYELGGITVTMLCPATTELLPAEDAEGGEAP